MSEELILDDEALGRMGFHAKRIILIEYDMHSEWLISEDIPIDEAESIARRNKLARKFRNRLTYLLKYKLKATQHLQSCWIIEGKYLKEAIEALETLKQKMKDRGFNDADRRIRIIHILTRPKDNKYYDTKKANYLLQFITEGLRHCDKAEEDGKIKKSDVWRIENAIEIIGLLKEEVEGHKFYPKIEEGLEKLKKRHKDVEVLRDLGEEEED